MTEVDVEPTGERFIPELMHGDLIEAEHHARYHLAMNLVRGCRVLDAGCGVGWGSQLLLDAGAVEVTGIDRDPEAIDDARTRTPQGRFFVADLTSLGLADALFDVVVCFEALEHVLDPAACLDELVRVLHPDGILLVSSPNPDVYPSGNPFHFYEMTPAELQGEVAKRLEHTTVLRQHLLISSLLAPDEPAPGPAAPLDTVTWSIAALEPGHDPYSLVAASRLPLPAIQAVEMLAPSHQLDDLQRLAEALTDERERVQRDRAELDAERQALLDRQADDQKRLMEADDLLRGLARERDDARAALAAAGPDRQPTGRFDHLTAERDRYAADLVHCEQEMARRVPRVNLDALAVETRRADDARAELEAVMHTTSWRVTRPLRLVRRLRPATLRRLVRR
jgi:SAM-dependent methyltransferase